MTKSDQKLDQKPDQMRADDPVQPTDRAADHNSAADAKGHARRLATTFCFNLIIFIAEVVGAVITHSLALGVDCAHMLTDLAVLAASLTTAILMSRKPTQRRTWGWDRLEILTSAVSAAVLLLVGAFAIIEAVRRLFFEPDPVEDMPLLALFGAIGLLANIASLFVLRAQRGDNLNMKAAFLEVCNDALGSVAVLLGCLVMWLTGWGGADAVAGAVIAVLIFPRALKILSHAVRVLLIEVPEGIDPQEVRRHLSSVPGVVAVHDLHIGTIRTGLVTLSAHVTIARGIGQDEQEEILRRLQTCVRDHFPIRIEHTTFQLEPKGFTSIEEREGEQLHK